MSRFEIIQHAGEGETFAPQAFDDSIGKTVPVKVEGGDSGEAELVAAVVADDGKSARLTLDTLVYHVEMEAAEIQHTDQEEPKP